jgi:hypothetical protein
MESLLFLVFIVAVLVVLDALAERFGVDSRVATLDDWARSVTP